MLSKESLSVLQQLFSPQSNLQLPVSIAKQVIEIRDWVEAESQPQPLNK